MSDETTATEPRIRFGDGANQHVPPAIAEDILRAYRQRDPVRFGEDLSRSLVGPDAVRVRKARNGSGR